MRRYSSKYESKLTISYYYKDNSGPGDSRNWNEKKPKVIILSFLILIVLFLEYLTEVDKVLKQNYVDCFWWS
jgi:hypothetical protein